MFFQERPRFGARVVKIKRTWDGLLEQNCDVYIAFKIQNDHWNLPWSEWANPYYNQEDALEKYAAHVKHKLWHKLDSLEGKLLGCWCRDESRCHGSVLVQLLEEKKMKDLQKKFQNCGLRVDTFDLEHIRRAYEWAEDPQLLAYATRLDRTNIFYFQPPVLEAILRLWNIPPPQYWSARTRDDNIYWVVGMYDGPQPLGRFWNNRVNLDDLEDVVVPYTPFYPAMSHVRDLFEFAKLIQTAIDAQPERFKVALVEALHYHTLHRCVVRRVGVVSQVDMDDHDLTKSRIVHVALAYWHHWDGPHDQRLLDAAIRAVRAGHCEMEDHHPEFGHVQNGAVDVHKLIVDRLSVHLQKDPVDKENGWDINLNFIPLEYRHEWFEFKRTHSFKELYHECLYKAKKDVDTGCTLYRRFDPERESPKQDSLMYPNVRSPKRSSDQRQ